MGVHCPLGWLPWVPGVSVSWPGRCRPIAMDTCAPPNITQTSTVSEEGDRWIQEVDSLGLTWGQEPSRPDKQ